MSSAMTKPHRQNRSRRGHTYRIHSVKAKPLGLSRSRRDRSHSSWGLSPALAGATSPGFALLKNHDPEAGRSQLRLHFWTIRASVRTYRR